MAERGSDPEAYLTEIDRRLRAIQGELEPGRARAAEPAPRRGRSGPLAAILRRSEPSERSEPSAAADPRPPLESSGGVVQQVRAMAELQGKLIAAIEDLLEVCERPAAASADEVTLSAGPFADTGSLRAFERALAELPGVLRVTVRGYEGTDRAIIDVELEPPPAGLT
jgi:hypothetical protein